MEADITEEKLPARINKYYNMKILKYQFEGPVVKADQYTLYHAIQGIC